VLAVVKETLTGLGGPGRVVVANLWLLAAEVVGQVLGLDSVGTEPEEPLLETRKLPGWLLVTVFRINGYSVALT
jgi:hypothetical protein